MSSYSELANRDSDYRDKKRSFKRGKVCANCKQYKPGEMTIDHVIPMWRFTGSYKAGKALYDVAVSRPEPIPVYVEMGSTNPVLILPQALKERGQEIAAAYSTSVTLGVGQFCTNPGLLIYQSDDDNFKHSLRTAFEKTTGGVMLTPNILHAYQTGVQQRLATAGVEQLTLSCFQPDTETNNAIPVLMKTNSNVFNTNPQLSEEIFGPTGS